MPRSYLDFEEPLRLLDLEREAALLRGDDDALARIDRETADRARKVAAGLTPWHRLQVARRLGADVVVQSLEELGASSA